MYFNPKGLWITAVGLLLVSLALSGYSTVTIGFKLAIVIAVIVGSIGVVRGHVRGRGAKR